MSEDKASKTEKPTARRLSKAREEGQVGKSMEVNTFAVLITALMILFVTGGGMYNELSDMMVHTLSNAAQISIEGADLFAFLDGLVVMVGKIMAPLLAGVALAGVLANYFQIGPLFTTKPLAFNITKLNPVSGLKKIFSIRSLGELVKSVLKLLIVASVAYFTIKGEMENIMVLGDMEPADIGLYVLAISFEIFLKACWALAILAAIDYIFQKWRYTEDMKMSKEEIKEEQKQTEGDPMVKSRIRSAQREMARKRMMAMVPKADVVVTNPTHLAVALLYDPNQADAPLVVAKGQALIAEKIKSIAREHGVMVMEDKPLAQALFKSVEVGQTIPTLFYQAVAEMLAYVYRVKGRKVKNGR